MGGSRHGGTPIAGWMRTGGTPILGEPHIYTSKQLLSGKHTKNYAKWVIHSWFTQKKHVDFPVRYVGLPESI